MMVVSLLRPFALLITVTFAQAICPWDDPDLKPWTQAGSWPSGNVPVANEAVVITTGMKILLDGPIPRLESIIIEAGAKLVWGDVNGIVMETKSVLVKGEMWVGSDTNRFIRQGGILLYGKSTDSESTPGFGRKFIGVADGGVLEIHGEDRISWTKLTATAGPANRSCGLLFDSRDGNFKNERGEGIHLTLWRPDGQLVEHNLFLTEHATAAADNMDRMLTYVQGLPTGLVLGLGVFRDLGRVSDTSLPWAKVHQALELLGATRSAEVGEFEPYALVTVTGDTSSTQETVWSGASTGATKEAEAKLAIDSSKLTFIVRSTVTPGSSPNEARFRVVASDWESPKISLMHDVSTWRAGDQVVLASTDFDWRQAEVKTVVECSDCAPNQIKLEGELRYSHFGEVTHGVDERGEVGLLTRNFKVEGQLEEQCYFNTPEEEDLCNKFGRDTFGGHIKVNKGGVAHLEGLEALHLGQQSTMGAYPIHYHMCDDVSGMYVRQVAVHESLARCVTIHVTDGLELSDMVCYLHLGHGVYLEDAAETGNTIHHNLVLGTMNSMQTPGDKSRDWCPYNRADACDMLSSYWITHPNNTVTDNVAAGSDLHGISFSFADVPMSPGYERWQERGILVPYSSRYIQVTEFSGCTAHSNRKSGLWFDDRLSVGEIVKGEFVDAGGRADISRYSARNPPTEDGERIDTVFSGLTFYKNIRFDSWVRCGNIILTKSSYADSPEGYTAPHVDDRSQCTVTDSIFIGETDNMGEAFDWTRGDGIYADLPSNQRPGHHFTRSAPDNNPEAAFSGVSIYQGPVLVDNCFFDRYYNDFFNDSFTDGSGNRNVRPGAAISFSRSNNYPSTPTSGVSNIKYGFCDGQDNHHYVFNGNTSTRSWKTLDGSFNVNFRDYDGSVTGTPNTQVVNNRPFFTGTECRNKPDWGVAVCPYNYFWLVVRGEDGVMSDALNKQWPILISRDDAPTDVINMKGSLGSKFVVRTNMSYTVRFNNSLGATPTNVRLRAFYGPADNDVIRVAICFPKTTTQFEIASFNPRIDNHSNLPNFVTSLAALDADTTGNAFYWDSSSGYFYLKLQSDQARDGPYQLCPGEACRDFTIDRLDGGAGPAVCDDQVTPFSGVQTLSPVPSPPVCTGVDSPAGLGAPVVASPAQAPGSEGSCASTPSANPTRGPIERRGCSDDPEIEEAYTRLYSTMTPQHCADKCFERGYHYAGLSSGTICKCSNTFSTSRPLDDAECNSLCSGDPTQTCGGSGKTEVFTTGLVLGSLPASCGPDNRGVVYNGDTCLYLSPLREEYIYAQSKCLRLGGSLAKIDSAQKQEAIEKYLGAVINHVWVGSAWLDGQWVHLDRTPLSGYSNWLSGAYSVSTTRFIRLRADKDLQWDNYGYWDRNMVLCDLPNPWSGPPEVERCGIDGWGIRVDGSCIAQLPTEEIRLQGEYSCNLIGGKIAPAVTAQEKATVEKFLYLHGSRTYFFVDGSASGSSVSVGYENRYFPDMKEFGITNRIGTLCLLEELGAITKCPTGWIVSPTGSCYLNKGTVIRNIEEVSAFCSSENSHVLRIETEAENQFIKEAIPGSKIWLDLRYSPLTDDFRRSDGAVSPWLHFLKNGPKTLLSEGACVNMDTASTGGTWRNKRCYSGASIVVCEMPHIK